MPRVSGVSGTSATRPMRVSPRRVRFWRWSKRRRIALPICRTLMVARFAILLFRHRLGFAALAAARLQGRDFEIAARGYRARAVLMPERVESGAHHVVGIGRADRLRHHVLHAERFEYRAHRAAGDDAGAGRRRAQEHAAGAMAAEHVMMERTALAQRHPHEAAFGGLGRLADRLGHFARLAVAEADPALLVADNDERREAEPAAALDHLGDAVDVHELVDELAVALFPLALARVPPFPSFQCHWLFSLCCVHVLEVQAALARRIGQRLDAAVEEIASAVEHHVLDALCDRALGHELADRLGGGDVGPGLEALA